MLPILSHHLRHLTDEKNSLSMKTMAPCSRRPPPDGSFMEISKLCSRIEWLPPSAVHHPYIIRGFNRGRLIHATLHAVSFSWREFRGTKHGSRLVPVRVCVCCTLQTMSCTHMVPIFLACKHSSHASLAIPDPILWLAINSAIVLS